jgi:hypothetical protein
MDQPATVTRVAVTYEQLGTFDRDGRQTSRHVGPCKLTWFSPPHTGVFFLINVEPFVPEKEPSK